jgi:hypothetical protein
MSEGYFHILVDCKHLDAELPEARRTTADTGSLGPPRCQTLLRASDNCEAICRRLLMKRQRKR